MREMWVNINKKTLGEYRSKKAEIKEIQYNLQNRPPVFLELKTERGRLTSLQRVQGKRLLELGQDVKTVYGIGELALFFRDEGYADAAQEYLKDKIGSDDADGQEHRRVSTTSLCSGRTGSN